jgi:hypothetical protein
MYDSNSRKNDTQVFRKTRIEPGFARIGINRARKKQYIAAIGRAILGRIALVIMKMKRRPVLTLPRSPVRGLKVPPTKIRPIWAPFALGGGKNKSYSRKTVPLFSRSGYFISG